MTPAFMVSPVGAVAKRVEIVRRFSTAGAFSAASARKPGELGLSSGRAFERLVNGGVLREVKGGRFWLDETANDEFHRRRRWSIVGAVVFVGLVVAVAKLVW